ncbi:MAG: hypothetical protein K0S47_2848 [Herbinix sp.]|jgi:AraC family cel operon transcriptional repressor|nr:hypothetical protein [Herbinix sp.]
MNRILEFSDYARGNKKHYIADLELSKNSFTYAHKHNFYEFFIVLNGEFEELFNTEKLILAKRMVHFIQPNDSHYYKCGNQYEKNILRNIAVEKNYFEQYLSSVGVEHKETIFRSFQLDEITYQNFVGKSDLLLEVADKDETKHFIFQSILSDLLVSGLIQKNKEHIPAWLQTAYHLVNRNKNYVEGLDKFVALSGKSQEHFTREFKKYYNMTPSDYINNLRLQEIASLLCTSNSKIIDLVYQSGFNNISYFNRLFRERYGMSPREYRDINKNFFTTSI